MFEVTAILPLVRPRTCMNCHSQFVRIRGFKTQVGPYYGGIGTWKYLCGYCVGNKGEAREMFDILAQRRRA